MLRTVRKPKMPMKLRKSLRVKPMQLRLNRSLSKTKSMQEKLRSLQQNASENKVTNLAHFNRVKSQLVSGPALQRRTLTLIG